MPTTDEQLRGGIIPIPRPRRPIHPIGGALSPSGAVPAGTSSAEEAAPEVPAAPAPPDALADVTRRMQDNTAQLRSMTPPAPARGARAVGGTIATILGSMVNPEIGRILSQKILNPGMAEWKQQHERLLSQQDADESELRRLEAQARIANMAANQKGIDADRDAARVDRQREAAVSEEGRLRGQGAEDLPQNIPAILSRRIINPGDMPELRTRMIPGVSAEQQAAGIGTVKNIEGGGYKSKVVMPSEATKQGRTRSAAQQKKRDEADVEKESWAPVTEEIAKRYPALGLKVGEKIDPARLDRLALHPKDKPEENPARILLNPKDYTPEQVAQAKKMWVDQHREPSGSDGTFQTLTDDFGVITGFFNPKSRQFVEPPAEGSRKAGLSPTENVRRANLQGTIEDLATLAQMAPKHKDKIGAAYGRLTDLELKTIGDKDPEVAEMFRLSKRMADDLLRQKSGAAITEKEYDRLIQLVPHPSQPYSTFMANLKSYQNEVGRFAPRSTGGKVGTSPAANTPATGKIAVISPEGVEGDMDAAKWPEAQKRGFRKK